ncbi:PGC-1 and ERR-induced regulator in muscle protein 1 [Tupaia chinensis]|uniref:PGC-1 and ERR-induced regulator in muscle protein 1 n=1 Tax=Tupaia chinensis TaxID=246437 RepID=UPI000FFB6BA9|nr:PGC-1 and ERR-induced regulator in muscle protein 1 [Tupaia chinensis]
MENFQYSVHLSDQDWAEFSATADECGLPQASLASGDELLSSDIDQGDSSGSSPPGPPSFFTGQLAPAGRGWQSCEEEDDDVATQQLVSRSQCEPVLALGACQQTPGTSTQSEARPSLGSGATPLGQSSPVLWPESSGDDMQRLLKGPAPSPPGEPPPSPESPGRSPGGPPRSPSRKKRRAVGAKGSGRLGAPGPAPAQLETRPEEGPGLAGSREKSPVAEMTKVTGEAGQDKWGSGSLESPPEQVAQQGSGVDLSTSVPVSEQGVHGVRTTHGAQLLMALTPVQEAHPDVSVAKPDVAVSTPACEPQPRADVAVSTPASKPQAEKAVSTPASKPQADVAESTPASEPRPDLTVSTPASKPQSDITVSTPASKPQADIAVSTPPSKTQLRADVAASTPASEPRADVTVSTLASEPRLAVDPPIASPVVKPAEASPAPVSEAVPDTAPPHSVSKAESDVDVSTLTPRANSATPCWPPLPQAGPDVVETKVVFPGGHGEKPREESSAGAPGHHSGEFPLGPVPAPKRKKVRFNMAVSSPEEPEPGEASCRPLLATAHSSASRMATGGRGGPGAWDAVAVTPRSPQPRILKHLPPLAPSASAGPGPRSCFAVTLPEAYEFFFCDTIEEEDEDAEGVAAASQTTAEVQWPDMCEFFFQDCQAQRSRQRRGRSAAPPLRAEPGPASPQAADTMPISIPEAYEHFLGEDKCGSVLGPATLLQLQNSETPRLVFQGAGPRTPLTPGSATAEQLGLAVGQAGELRSPLTSFTFSQNDMCLVFVAFATWAVKTSDLHTPDAWKTVLLANLGTISAIRYFRRQVGRGRHSPSPSRSPSPSSSSSS